MIDGMAQKPQEPPRTKQGFTIVDVNLDRLLQADNMTAQFVKDSGMNHAEARKIVYRQFFPIPNHPSYRPWE